MKPQPWFGGARSVEEQMLGLAPALEEARGKQTVDLGCAEGDISILFAMAGAKVLAFDYNAQFIAAAESRRGNLPVKFIFSDLNQMIQKTVVSADIILALSVLHKLHTPADGVRYCCQCARDLIVIRLPKGSTGKIKGKQWPFRPADIPAIMKECGFAREQKHVGPRGEWVHYYRRKG